MSPETRAHVAKLLRLLSSDLDGEALGVARAMVRVLRSNGHDLHDLADLIENAPAIEPPRGELPPWQVMVEIVGQHLGELSAKEIQFIRSLRRWRGEPTSKQFVWLSGIFERVAT